MDDSNKEAIRSLSNQAAADFQQGRYESARDKFSRAFRIAEVPKLAVWAARANEKLGHLVTAYELYLRALSLQPNDLWKADVQQQAQKDAQDELDKLQPRIPKLTIVIEGANSSDVSVNVDNVQIPSDLLGVERYADPGQRKIAGRRSDEVVDETVTLTEGDNRRVVLKFRNTTAPALTAPAGAPLVLPGRANAQPGVGALGKTPAESFSSASNPRTPRDQGASSTSSQRALGWIGVGTGAAGLALGATTGLLVALKHGNLKTECPVANDCQGQHTTEVNTYNTMRTLSTVGFVVGGAATAAGVTLLLTTPKEKTPAHIRLLLAPNAAAITGNF
jgi:hypothetical protein